MFNTLVNVLFGVIFSVLGVLALFDVYNPSDSLVAGAAFFAFAGVSLHELSKHNE